MSRRHEIAEIYLEGFNNILDWAHTISISILDKEIVDIFKLYILDGICKYIFGVKIIENIISKDNNNITI